MSEQEQELERIKEELTDLCGNVGQIMQMLQAMKVRMDTLQTMVSEVRTPGVEQPPTTAPLTRPPLGLYPELVHSPRGQSPQYTVYPTTEVNQVAPTYAPNAVNAQIQPFRSMSESDVESHERVLGSVTTNFSDLGAVSVKVEMGSKNGKIDGSSQGNAQNPAAAPPYQQQSTYQQRQALCPPTQSRRKKLTRRAPFPQIPMTYTSLYPILLQKGLVTPKPMGPPPYPLPPYYDPNVSCLFHGGAPGHSLESCFALKHIVRELMEEKMLSFGDDNPKVENNLSPAHGSYQHHS